MDKNMKEKPPFWFLVAPIMVVVFIYLVLLLSGKIVSWIGLQEQLGIPILVRYLMGIPLILTGSVFFIWGFSHLKPTAAIGYARKLRIKGAYSIIRNPMYFGVNAAFWGTGFLFNDVSVLIGASIWTLLNYLSVILWEEKQMYRKFGEEYTTYKKNVPRFIPLKWIRKK